MNTSEQKRRKALNHRVNALQKRFPIEKILEYGLGIDAWLPIWTDPESIERQQFIKMELEEKFPRKAGR